MAGINLNRLGGAEIVLESELVGRGIGPTLYRNSDDPALLIRWDAAKIRSDATTLVTVSASTLTVTDATTTYIWVTSAGAVLNNTTGYPTSPAPIVLMGKVTAAGGVITVIDIDLAPFAPLGISENQHKTLLQLIHFIDEGPSEGFTTGATKTTTGTVFPTQNRWKRSDATNLVDQNITWTGVNPTTVEWKIYDTNGSTVLATVTDTITYSGVFETGRTRSIA